MMTTREVAHNAVNRWALNGDLPGWRTPGGHWRYDPAAVRDFSQVGFDADLMTTREVAEFFRVSTETILRWTLQGHLQQAPVPGRGHKYKRESVLELSHDWAMPAEQPS